MSGSAARRIIHLSTPDHDETTPSWHRPKSVKSQFDFPRAKRGRPDRIEFVIQDRKPGRPRRLDKFLMERFVGYSRTYLQKLIKEGNILVNDRRIKSSWHISPGEKITIMLPQGYRHGAEDISFEILYEDPYFIAVNKPPGLVVHPARGNLTGTLYNGLLHYFHEQIQADPSFHIGTVHRLDEDTSGVLVVALDRKANKELTYQFENRLLQKTYLCLVQGQPEFRRHTINAPIGIDPSLHRAMAIDGLDAKDAETEFERVDSAADSGFSIMRAHPKTGRSHQIRVHLKALGFPIVGDALYGGILEHPLFDAMKPRLCLHAEALALNHPHTAEPMVLNAPLPEDIRTLARRVGIAAFQ